MRGIKMDKVKINLDSMVVVKQDIPAVSLGDEVALLNVETGKYFGLGDTGSSIWKLIEEPSVLVEVVEKLMQEYEVDREVCSEHVLEFIGNLLEEELIEVK